MDVGVMRLKGKTEESKLLGYTGLRGGRGHLKIETRECQGSVDEKKK